MSTIEYVNDLINRSLKNKYIKSSYKESILKISNFKIPDKIPSFVKSDNIKNIFNTYKVIRINFANIIGVKGLKDIESANSVEKIKKQCLKLLKDIHNLGYIKDGLEKQFLLKLKDSSVNIKNISERLLSDFNLQDKREMLEVINEALNTKKQKWIDNKEIERINKELNDLDKNEKLTVEQKNQLKGELAADLKKYLNKLYV